LEGYRDAQGRNRHDRKTSERSDQGSRVGVWRSGR
jgi:hypothetical protein